MTAVFTFKMQGSLLFLIRNMMLGSDHTETFCSERYDCVSLKLHIPKF